MANNVKVPHADNNVLTVREWALYSTNHNSATHSIRSYEPNLRYNARMNTRMTRVEARKGGVVALMDTT